MGLKPEDAYTAQLQAILRIAHNIKEVASVSLPSEHSRIPSHAPAVIDSIRLPNPRPLFPLLVEAGFGHEIAAAADKMYIQHAEELRCRIQESIFATWRKMAELPVTPPVSSADLLITKVVSTSTEIYFRRLEQWKEDIIQRIKQASNILPKATSRNAFNYEYVPLLEHFFEENPFPTHADKMFLAKKTSMQYKQIHVWFQNRRNRTKKDGKVLKKKLTYEGPMKPFDNPYVRMRGHKVKSDSQTLKTSKTGPSEGATGIEVARNDASKDAFALSSPPHAFPSSYPPTCHYDPFPCKSGPVHFHRPEWRRASSGTRPLPLSTSINELADKFSQLNVRDDSRSVGPSKLQSHAATAAITVVPSRAPHPSRLLCKYQQTTNTVQCYPITRAAVSSLKVFPNLSFASKPVTLVPRSTPLSKSELPGKRKIAPLPRRLPDQTRNTCRDTTPSESSSISSPSPRLFSPDFESRSCSFSSVSSLSTPSDIASAEEIPHLFGSPCRSLFGSPRLRNMGDMGANIPSSVS